MKLMRISPFTGKTNTLDLPIGEHDFHQAIARWNDGAMIQDAFPMLNAGEREFIKTGITPQEWDNLFGGGPNEDA
jgi:hypothetical protein